MFNSILWSSIHLGKQMFCPCAIPDEDTNYEDFMFNLSLLKTGQTLLKAVPFGSYLLIPPVYPPLRSPLLQSWPHSLGHFFFFFWLSTSTLKANLHLLKVCLFLKPARYHLEPSLVSGINNQSSIFNGSETHCDYKIIMYIFLGDSESHFQCGASNMLP